jgi:SRSO17 transposase
MILPHTVVEEANTIHAGIRHGSAIAAGCVTNYCAGLLLPGERKSVEPMAARLAGDNVRRMHQSLHHVVAEAPWSDEAVLDRSLDFVIPAMLRRDPVVAWVIDDTGFPKKGRESVGVARQYCGQVGKQDNCRVAVSLSMTTEKASMPVAYRLYVPQSWIEDRKLKWAPWLRQRVKTLLTTRCEFIVRQPNSHAELSACLTSASRSPRKPSAANWPPCVASFTSFV